MYDVVHCIHVYLFTLCVLPAQITRCSVETACMEEASNTYTCTIMLCYHTLYSILILTYVYEYRHCFHL